MIETKRHQDVIEIVIANAPVNALAAAVRHGLAKAISAAETDSTIVGIVITGQCKFFSAGADITEFGRPMADPGLPEVVSRIEACEKPVVAAINGVAFGGGLEIALGCHHRIAVPSAQLGLPEVKLGLLPGAGGTQRLPRLTGVELALEMIAFGNPISAAKALQIGLVDQVVGDDALLQTAIACARSANPVQRTGEREVRAPAEIFEAFAVEHKRKIGRFEAPLRCIEAVKAAVELPLAQGLAKESEIFVQLMEGSQSRAQRHIFAAERTAAKIDDVPKNTALRDIKKLGVIGAGTMGGGIAMNFLSVGIAVTIIDMTDEALRRGVGVIRSNYEATAATGRITSAQVEAAMALLSPTTQFADLADCDLVIEAVYENMGVKKEIFSQLDGVVRQGAILASNTSYLDIDEIASVTSRPHDVVGLHFFSPANVMKLVEVIRGEKTALDVLATAVALARKIRKVPVVAGVCYGFIGNRMLIPRQGQAPEMLLEGATPEQVDRVHTSFGMPMGPFQMADLAGVDIGWHRDPARIESIQDALCSAGRWGQKTKAGFYDYDDRRRATPSAEVEVMVASLRDRAGITTRVIDDEEIAVRTLYTMVNEASLILEEGIAQRPSDIDVVYAYGYGWPLWRGGPMFWADEVGLSKIVEGLNQYSQRLGKDFRLSETLVRMAANNDRFTPAQIQ